MWANIHPYWNPTLKLLNFFHILIGYIRGEKKKIKNQNRNQSGHWKNLILICTQHWLKPSSLVFNFQVVHTRHEWMSWCGCKRFSTLGWIPRCRICCIIPERRTWGPGVLANKLRDIRRTVIVESSQHKNRIRNRMMKMKAIKLAGSFRFSYHSAFSIPNFTLISMM
jgi:hypothetical protein